MASGILETVRALRAEGATSIAFHADGSVASVAFGPVESEYQHEGQDTATETPTRRVTGALVPRAPTDRV